MTNPFFSIIVPVYKVEEYLDQCVQSVLVQTFCDYELILVDDGSPDSCGSMCDSFAEGDQRVKVVHKRNGGLSSARNAGLDIAAGEYVVFLDSDDFWDDETALEHFHDNLEETKADLLVFPAKRYYGVENKVTYILNSKVERSRVTDSDVNRAISYMLENNIFRAAAWNKVIRKSIIDAHEMRFKEGYLSEDMDWCGDLLIYCTKFDFYEESLYCYRQQRVGSITAGKTEKLVADKIYMCQKGYKQALAIQDGERSKLLLSYYAYEYSVALGVSSGLKDKKILNDLKQLQVLLDYDLCNKVKQVNTFKKFLGYTLTRKILCIFVKMKR